MGGGFKIWAERKVEIKVYWALRDLSFNTE